jgi:hypothetical protein
MPEAFFPLSLSLPDGFCALFSATVMNSNTEITLNVTLYCKEQVAQTFWAKCRESGPAWPSPCPDLPKPAPEQQTQGQ